MSIYPEIPPATVVQAFLVNEAIFTDPGSAWPLYISHLPDGDNVEDNAAGIFDTSPSLDGRQMDGEVIQHYGFRLLIRVLNYETGWLKAKAVLSKLAETTDSSLTVRGETFTLYSFTTLSGIIFLGTEDGTKRRYLFELTYTVSMKQTT